MDTSGRQVASICLGVLALLAVGALILSVTTASTTPVPQGQVNQSSLNLAAASSFQLTVRGAERTSASAANPTFLTKLAIVTYEAPDRVSLVQPLRSGGYQIQIFIGSQAWQSTNSGRTFVKAPTQPGLTPPGESAAQNFLALPNALGKVTGVTARTAGFTFATTNPDLLIATGLTSSAPPTLTTQARVTLAGVYLATFGAVFSASGQQLLVDYRYDKIGDAHVNPPPTASVQG